MLVFLFIKLVGEIVCWVVGIVVFFFLSVDGILLVLLYNFKYNYIVYECVVIFMVVIEGVLYVVVENCCDVV